MAKVVTVKMPNFKAPRGHWHSEAFKTEDYIILLAHFKQYLKKKQLLLKASKDGMMCFFLRPIKTSSINCYYLIRKT